VAIIIVDETDCIDLMPWQVVQELVNTRYTLPE